MPLKNILAKVKSLEPLSRDIERLAEADKQELEKLGIDLKGLFHELEPEALRIAEAYADFYVARYESEGKRLMRENPEKFKYLLKLKRYLPNGSLPEKRKQEQFRMGLTQKAFELFLQQIQVAYIPNDPAIDWREKFKYDFRIPLFGSIDIKSALFSYPTPLVNINMRDFESEKPDFAVAYLILDTNQPRWLKLLGILKASEIRGYEVVEGSRPYWSVPASDFEKHDGNELLRRLLIVKHELEKLEKLSKG